MFNEAALIFNMCIVLTSVKSTTAEWSDLNHNLIRHPGRIHRKHDRSVQIRRQDDQLTSKTNTGGQSSQEQENGRYWSSSAREHLKHIYTDGTVSVNDKSDRNANFRIDSDNVSKMDVKFYLRHQHRVTLTTNSIQRTSTNGLKIPNKEHNQIYETAEKESKSPANRITESKSRREIYQNSETFSSSTNKSFAQTNTTVKNSSSVNGKHQSRDSNEQATNADDNCTNFVSCVQPYVAYIAGSIMFLLVVYLIIVFGKCVCDDSY